MEEKTLLIPSVKRMVSVEVIDSTQNLARELALQAEPEGTLVLAYEQTGGRGQYDRNWDAKRGGVYFFADFFIEKMQPKFHENGHA